MLPTVSGNLPVLSFSLSSQPYQIGTVIIIAMLQMRKMSIREVERLDNTTIGYQLDLGSGSKVIKANSTACVPFTHKKHCLQLLLKILRKAINKVYYTNVCP